jgi:hypothetical protein
MRKRKEVIYATASDPQFACLIERQEDEKE